MQNKYGTFASLLPSFPQTKLPHFYVEATIKSKKKKALVSINVIWNRCFDCRDKKRSFFTMTPHKQGEEFSYKRVKANRDKRPK